MLTYSQFVARYPEFETADATLVAAVLDEQEAATADDWGVLEDEYHGLTTCQALARTAFGNSAAFVNPKTHATRWDARIRELRRIYAVSRNRVVI